MRIKEIVSVRVRYGYRRIYVLLRQEGWYVYHKRVYRLYKEEELNLRNKSKRNKVSGPRVLERNTAAALNECWTIDFVSDQLFNGKRFSALTLIETYSRECLTIYADKAIMREIVANVLDEIKVEKGLWEKSK